MIDTEQQQLYKMRRARVVVVTKNSSVGLAYDRVRAKNGIIVMFDKCMFFLCKYYF